LAPLSKPQALFSSAAVGFVKIADQGRASISNKKKKNKKKKKKHAFKRERV